MNLLGEKEPKLNLQNTGNIENKIDEHAKKNNLARRVIFPSKEELELHEKYLKSSLAKNNYN